MSEQPNFQDSFSKKSPRKAGPPRDWISRLDRITSEVTTLFGDRLVWRYTRDVAEKSAAVVEQPYFMSWITRQYAMSVSLGVRKMADRDRRAASFSGLFERMIEHPERLTRDWFCSDVYVGLQPAMDASFSERADPKGIGHFDPEVAREDQERLDAGVNAIERYVDQYVAHAQHKPTANIPTFGELDAGIDLLGELLQKYTLLLTQGWRAELEPVFQFPWQRVFDRAWSETRTNT